MQRGSTCAARAGRCGRACARTGCLSIFSRSGELSSGGSYGAARSPFLASRAGGLQGVRCAPAPRRLARSESQRESVAQSGVSHGRTRLLGALILLQKGSTHLQLFHLSAVMSAAVCAAAPANCRALGRGDRWQGAASTSWTAGAGSRHKPAPLQRRRSAVLLSQTTSVAKRSLVVRASADGSADQGGAAQGTGTKRRAVVPSPVRDNRQLALLTQDQHQRTPAPGLRPVLLTPATQHQEADAERGGGGVPADPRQDHPRLQQRGERRPLPPPRRAAERGCVIGRRR